MAEPYKPGPNNWEKLTLFFNLGVKGWSESYYMNGRPDTPQDDPFIQEFVKARVAMLGGKKTASGPDVTDWPKLVAYRLSAVIPRRRSLLVSPDPTIARLNENNRATINPAVGLNLIVQEDLKRYKRFVFLRAMPDPWLPIEYAYSPGAKSDSAAFTAAMNTFQNLLTNVDQRANNRSPQFGILAQDKNTKVPRDPIIKITKGGNPDRYTVTINNNTYVKGQQVLIQGVHGLGVKGLNGTHIILRSDQQTGELELAAYNCGLCPPDPTSFGVVTKKNQDVASIVYGERWKWSERDLGAAFFATHGRR